MFSILSYTTFVFSVFKNSHKSSGIRTINRKPRLVHQYHMVSRGRQRTYTLFVKSKAQRCCVWYCLMGVSASHRVNLIGQNFPKKIAHTKMGLEPKFRWIQLAMVVWWKLGNMMSLIYIQEVLLVLSLFPLQNIEKTLLKFAEENFGDKYFASLDGGNKRIRPLELAVKRRRPLWIAKDELIILKD